MNPFSKCQFGWMLEFLEKLKNREIEPELPVAEKDKCPPLLVSTIKQMVSFDPLERPTAKHILMILEDRKTKKQSKELGLKELLEIKEMRETNSREKHYSVNSESEVLYIEKNDVNEKEDN